MIKIVAIVFALSLILLFLSFCLSLSEDFAPVPTAGSPVTPPTSTPPTSTPPISSPPTSIPTSTTTGAQNMANASTNDATTAPTLAPAPAPIIAASPAATTREQYLEDMVKYLTIIVSMHSAQKELYKLSNGYAQTFSSPRLDALEKQRVYFIDK